MEEILFLNLLNCTKPLSALLKQVGSWPRAMVYLPPLFLAKESEHNDTF